MDRYLKAKKRIIRNTGNKDITDYEIAEELEKEIEQYRFRINNLERIVKGLKGLNETVEVTAESNIYHCGVDGGTGQDFTVTRWYEDGILMKEEIRPCNEAQKEKIDENDCPPIIPGFHCTG